MHNSSSVKLFNKLSEQIDILCVIEHGLRTPYVPRSPEHCTIAPVSNFLINYPNIWIYYVLLNEDLGHPMSPEVQNMYNSSSVKLCNTLSEQIDILCVIEQGLRTPYATSLISPACFTISMASKCLYSIKLRYPTFSGYMIQY